MSTRNERKRRARKAIAERREQEKRADNAGKVRAIVRFNKANGIERNFWPESPMGSLKEHGSTGKVIGLSRLAPLPDANGDWTKAVTPRPIDWQAVRQKRLDVRKREA